MKYSILFDITQSHDKPWLFPFLILSFIAVGSIVVFYFRFGRQTDIGKIVRTLVVSCSLAVLCSCICSVSIFPQYDSAPLVLESNNARVVEGVVTDFKRVSKDNEEYTVKGVYFRYGPSDLSNPGYKQSSDASGPIKNDVPVRIHYYYDPSRDQNIILKLEIGIHN